MTMRFVQQLLSLASVLAYVLFFRSASTHAKGHGYTSTGTSAAFVVRRPSSRAPSIMKNSFQQPALRDVLHPTRLDLGRPSNNTTSMDSQYPHKKSSTELSYSMSEAAEIGYKVYCDLDGVLVDFDTGVRKLLNASPSKLVKGTMWKSIARANAFYENLSWTEDGQQLWRAIRHLGPDILTGVPYPKSSRTDKFNWCKRELGLDELNHVDMAAGCRDHESVNGNLPREGVTNVITCWSNNKHMECSTYRSVLIDDRDSLRETWEQAGGIFVHHVNAESTIQKLREYGIITSAPAERD